MKTTKTKTLSYPFSISDSRLTDFVNALRYRHYFCFVVRKLYGYVVRVPNILVEDIEKVDKIYFDLVEIKIPRYE